MDGISGEPSTCFLVTHAYTNDVVALSDESDREDENICAASASTVPDWSAVSSVSTPDTQTVCSTTVITTATTGEDGENGRAVASIQDMGICVTLEKRPLPPDSARFGPRGKMQPRLTLEQKLRVMYLFAEHFRKESALSATAPMEQRSQNEKDKSRVKRHNVKQECNLAHAARVVADVWNRESGMSTSEGSMYAFYRNQAIPMPERKPLKPRGRRATVTTEDRVQAVKKLIQDPNIPLEMKTTRKLMTLLPEEQKMSKSAIRRIFEMIHKDKLLPKEQRQNRNHFSNK